MKTIELPIEAQTHGYSQHILNNYMEQEVSSFSFNFTYHIFRSHQSNIILKNIMEI